MIKVLLVDDQKLFINSLKVVLESIRPDIRIVKICYDGTTAVEYCRHHEPDIVLMDVMMPGMDGVRATEELLLLHPELKIIMLTTFDEDLYVQKALDLGAKGYLLKDMLPEELSAAIDTVMGGAVSMSPSVVKKLLVKKNPPDSPAWFNELTRKEWEVLRLISQGYDNREIAEEAHLARQTVKNYVSSIYEKLDVRDRMQVMRLCINLELFDD